MLWNYELLVDVRDKLFRILDVLRTYDELPLRVPLYAGVMGLVLMAAVVACCREAILEGRTGKITRVQLVTAWAFLILIALPFLPRTMNGSGFFAARFSIWPPLLWFAAASGVTLSRRAEKILIVAAVTVTVVTILTLNAHISPVAKQLDQSQTAKMGLETKRVFTRNNSRAPSELTFDPYEWAAVRVVDREHAILVDSPWMDLQIMMLETIGPKVKFEGDDGVRIIIGPPSKITMVFARCGNVRGESYADRIVSHHPQEWRMIKRGCFEVLDPAP
jgi:hypothetical protein